MAMSMRTPFVYIISVLGTIIFLAAVWTALFYFQLGMPTKNTHWTSALVTNKLKAVHDSVGDKLVFVAGSSGNFNVNAEAVSKATGIHSVNFGTHAILPLEYMLDHIKGGLHKGDVVVLNLEYLYYAADERLTSTYIDYLLARDPDYFRTLSVKEKLQFISSVSLKRLITPIKESFQKKESPYAYNVYSDFFYSPYGDQHSNNKVFLTKSMRDGRLAAPPEARIASIFASEHNWMLLKEFKAWCKLNGVLLLAAPPATIKFDVYDTPAYTDKLAALKIELENIGIPYIGDPYSVMYGRELFFDTNYHTNQEGKEAYTKALINWLKPYIKFRSEALPVQVAPDTPVDKALKDFNGWMPLSGLLTLEGPYPASNLPVVVWGAAQTKLQVETLSAGPASFKIEFMPNKQEQPLAILVDDQHLFSKRVIKSTDFETVEVVLPLSAGSHVITINSDDVSTSSSGTSVLYRSILFTPAK